MGIQVLESGMLTTIQDLGRIGFRGSGVPVSGAMDKIAASVANFLVGNNSNLPVLEITYGSCQFYTNTDLLIACCGGGATMTIDEIPILFWKPILVRSGSHIKLISTHTQTYSYLAVHGGWKSSYVLSSYSTYLPASLGGYEGRKLRKGDILTTNKEQPKANELVQTNWRVNPNRITDYTTRTIRVIKGHEYDWFDPQSLQEFEHTPFTISRQSNRMGYSLAGINIQQKEKRELLSTAVTTGTIQITTGGQPIILMADCQTTGGYPRIGQVAAIDIPVCAQLRPGEQITFTIIAIEEAEALYRSQHYRLQNLRKIIKGKGVIFQ